MAARPSRPSKPGSRRDPPHSPLLSSIEFVATGSTAAVAWPCATWVDSVTSTSTTSTSAPRSLYSSPDPCQRRRRRRLDHPRADTRCEPRLPAGPTAQRVYDVL